MPCAIITSGGKQYLVTDGSHIRVEKIPSEEGAKVVFKEVLLTNTGKTTKIGTPLVSGASVEGKVVTHGRHAKVVGVKMKPKKRQKKYFGHKQPYTEIEITKIKSK